METLAPKRNGRTAVTMRDVAARAGVTPVVVSKVLHDKAKSIRVSDSTAERVRQAAADLGYRCNVWARNFRTQQTHMIGVVHGIGFGAPRFSGGSQYFASLMDGLAEGAFAHDYSITLCPKLFSVSPEDAMCDGRFDGLIWYSTSLHEEARTMLMGCSVPLVVIHVRGVDVGGRFPSVRCDNYQGMALAVDHLAELGHRKIAYAMSEGPCYMEVNERFESFVAHLKRRGIPFGPEDVFCCDWEGNGADVFFQSQGGHTALVAHNESLAAGYLRAAPRFGVDVPRDLSIVGFDSTPFCNEQHPRLTAVSQPLQLMGRKAIDLLVQSIADPSIDPIEVIYSCGLDIRESTSLSSQVNI